MKNLIKQIKKARFIFVCGNGGSASTAEHLTNDLFSKGFRAICLNSNMSVMTMLANDFGYEYVFSKQLDRLANNEDLLITISCSGKSKNIVSAIFTGQKLGMNVYSFKKFGKDRDYETSEDEHLQLVHKIKREL